MGHDYPLSACMPTSINRRQFVNALAASAALGTTTLSAVHGQYPFGAARADAQPLASGGSSVTDVNTHNYRAASWWFRWEDFNYPDKGIEDKLRRRAAAFQAAGVDLALVFGFHCRWDYVYCFDRVHELIRLSCEACHEHGIKIFDHFSATGVHRPRSMAGEWKLYKEGRNRMTFHPSAEMAETLAWRSSRLNDWRMTRVQDNSVAFVDCYQFEMFCMNNPAFRKASVEYLKKLRAETDIDGLEFDDGVYYSGWDSCGCPHCRGLFKKRHGQELPDWRDTSFWGNYANPRFRQWVRFRYESAVDFLMLAKNTLGAEFPLSACCGGTSNKSTDSCGDNIHYFARATNHIMLEMCGEISTGLVTRVPEILISRAVAVRGRMPAYGCGFAFYPDPAFLVWMLNKFFGIGSWVSVGKGRVNVTTAEMINLPNEEDIVGEGYNYEKDHPDLFQGKPDSSLAILFSSDTKINHGDNAADYETAFHNLTQSCFEASLPADVVVTLDDAKSYPLLALADVACLGAAEKDALKEYLRQGGIVVASGPLGIKDEKGDLLKDDFLQEFGLRCRLDEPVRSVDAKLFFGQNPWAWANQRKPVADAVAVQTELTKSGDFYHIPIGQGHLYWNPKRLSNKAAIPDFLKQLRQSLPPPAYQIEAPPGLKWRAFRNGNELVIHFLNCDFVQVPHPHYQYLGKPIAESLRYNPPKGVLTIRGHFAQAELFSPDLPSTRRANAENGVILFELDGIRRFCSVKIR